MKIVEAINGNKFIVEVQEDDNEVETRCNLQKFIESQKHNLSLRHQDSKEKRGNVR